MAAEIGGRRFLTEFDDAAPDVAGPGKQREQPVAVAPTDYALQRAQVFGETAEDFEHGLLVVEEDVTPHGRIGGRDAREVAETAGRKFDDFRLGHFLEVSCRANDIVSDQVRHMARDREHEIVMLRRHHVHFGTAGMPEFFQPRHGGGIAAGKRREDAPALEKQVGKAGRRS